MARTGGVMGMTSVRSFVHDREPTTIEHLLDHYDYVARLVGVEHVGIGSDHSWEGYDASLRRDRGLIRRSYSDEHISLMLGGNFPRVLTEIWG